MSSFAAATLYSMIVAPDRRSLLLKKVLSVLGGFFVVLTTHAQASSPVFTAEQFASQVLSYEPIQREGVTTAKFEYAKRILQETKTAARQDPAQLNVADFWNITSAFVALQEPKKAIELAFKKAVSLDASAVCSYLNALGANGLDKRIPETFLPFYQECLQAPANQPSNQPSSLDPKLDAKLVGLLARIHQQDVQFRGAQPVNWARQRPLDGQNQHVIDSLYHVYHTYLGKNLVGSLTYVMWAVVQHSDLPMMERYLPVVQQAVQQHQLAIAPFKMLLDRVYAIKYGKQLFGSQVGVPLADEPVREQVLKSYALE
ncbi:MAG: hypothetical protein ACRYG7_16560 [Janthinobacterium lividum]